MTDKYLNEARQKLAEMRASLEVTRFAVEQFPDKDDPAYAQAKARTLKELEKTAESIESLAAQLGDVPAPVRH
ncbi:hypothetical protein KVG88_30195 [Pseudomonas sp. SWRI74]|uniref:Uncharacterized protein n=1 Tax=Pseudomonas azerbaijanoccidentalis TaxID=2842347 RepID=A0ABS6QZI4_9PSED|nr:hypothetical protein [Pseudomonas azerbaijanoccidentalis]MBV4524347.1 hypothetical protein [Pseudomonas azerbaijanoccidentalis]